MSVINELKFSFPSDSRNESIARMCIAAFVSSADPTVSELAEIKTAVSEAVTNSIVHGYRGKHGIVSVQAKLLDKNRLIIKISDKGCGIADIDKAREPLFTTAPEEERAGLGFAVMESFSDSITVKSTVGKGTSVTLRRTLSLHKADADSDED